MNRPCPSPERAGSSSSSDIARKPNFLIDSPSTDPQACRPSYLDFSYPDIASNLALDEALLWVAEEEDAGPVLRIWESPKFAVILGASGRLDEDVNVSLCEVDGVEVARRSSGGGTVVIGPGALNVAVVLSAELAPGLKAVDFAQLFVLEEIAKSIRAAGLNVRVQGSGDLTLEGRKFSGSAQRRLRRFFLVHASLLYDFPIERIVRYTRIPARQPPYREQRSHESFLTNLPLCRKRLVQTVKSAWLCDESLKTAEIPRNCVMRLVAEKFGDPAWIQRL